MLAFLIVCLVFVSLNALANCVWLWKLEEIASGVATLNLFIDLLVIITLAVELGAR